MGKNVKFLVADCRDDVASLIKFISNTKNYIKNCYENDFTNLSLLVSLTDHMEASIIEPAMSVVNMIEEEWYAEVAFLPAEDEKLVLKTFNDIVAFANTCSIALAAMQVAREQSWKGAGKEHKEIRDHINFISTITNLSDIMVKMPKHINAIYDLNMHLIKVVNEMHEAARKKSLLTNQGMALPGINYSKLLMYAVDYPNDDIDKVVIHIEGKVLSPDDLANQAIIAPELVNDDGVYVFGITDEGRTRSIGVNIEEVQDWEMTTGYRSMCVIPTKDKTYFIIRVPKHINTSTLEDLKKAYDYAKRYISHVFVKA